MARLDLTPAAFDVDAERGKTWKMVITCKDSNGAAVSLVGYSCTWVLAPRTGAAPIVLATTADHLSLGGVLGTVTLHLPPDVTAEVPVGLYVHEFHLVQPDLQEPPFLSGKWHVTGKVAA